MIIQNSQLRKCSLVIGGDYRYTDRVQVEFYREQGKHNHPDTVMLRPIPEIHKVYEISDHDRAVLNQLATIPAFDPYTLRSSLKETFRKLVDAGVLAAPVNFDETVFRLSAETQFYLARYTVHFTDPLLEALFDGLKVDLPHTRMSLVERLKAAELGSDPATRQKITENCQLMQERFGSKSLTEVSDILDEFGEKFLSIAYYKQYHQHAISKSLRQFMKELALLKPKMKDVKRIPNFERMYMEVLFTMRESLLQVEQILDGFERNLTSIWTNVDMQLFHDLVDLINECHKHMGTVLVTWAVRLDAWNHAKHSHQLDDIEKKADFIHRSVFTGLDTLPAEMKRIAETVESLDQIAWV